MLGVMSRRRVMVSDAIDINLPPSRDRRFVVVEGVIENLQRQLLFAQHDRGGQSVIDEPEGKRANAGLNQYSIRTVATSAPN